MKISPFVYIIVATKNVKSPIMNVVTKKIANIIAASEKAAGKKDLTVQKWLLDALPNVSKKDRQDLKMHGVEARRVGLDESKRRKGAQISTKSGYERKVENRKKGAVQGSKRRAAQDGATEAGSGNDSDFGGFDD